MRVRNPVGKLSPNSAMLALLLAIVPMQSQARSGGSVVTPVPGGFDIKFSKNGTPMAVTPGAAAGATVGTAVAFVPVAPGVTVAVTAVGAITAIASGAAAAGAAGAIGYGALYALPFIVDWMNRAKVRPAAGGGVEGAAAGSCTVAPCYEYFDGNGGGTGAWWKTLDGACSSRASYATSTDNNYQYTGRVTGGVCYLDYTGKPGSGYESVNATAQYNASIRERAVDSAPAYEPYTGGQFSAAMSAAAPTAAEVQALVDANFPPEVIPQTLTPAQRVIPVKTETTTNSDGSVDTTQTNAVIGIGSPTYIPVDLQKMFSRTTPASSTTVTENVVTTNPDGTTTTQSISRVINTPATTTRGTTTSTTTPDAPLPCGLGVAGSPDCRISETGTPAPVAVTVDNDKLKPPSDDRAALAVTAAGKDDKTPIFAPFSNLFSAPAIVACEGFVMPNQIGTINPCGVVDGVRAFMAYLWALAGFWWALAMIRESF